MFSEIMVPLGVVIPLINDGLLLLRSFLTKKYTLEMMEEFVDSEVPEAVCQRIAKVKIERTLRSYKERLCSERRSRRSKRRKHSKRRKRKRRSMRSTLGSERRSRRGRHQRREASTRHSKDKWMT